MIGRVDRLRVNADIDFTRTSTTQDLIDPDQVAVRSETRSSDNSTNSRSNRRCKGSHYLCGHIIAIISNSSNRNSSNSISC